MYFNVARVGYKKPSFLSFFLFRFRFRFRQQDDGWIDGLLEENE